MCNNFTHVAYCSVCKAVDGTIRKLTRSDQANQYHNEIIIMMDCHYRALGVDF